MNTFTDIASIVLFLVGLIMMIARQPDPKPPENQ